MKGHAQVTRKAFEYLARRGLLPAQLGSAEAQELVVYGTYFADHPWAGRPESAGSGVTNAMSWASRRELTSSAGAFSYPFVVDNWFDATMEVNARAAVAWQTGNLRPEDTTPKPSTALLFLVRLRLNANVPLAPDRSGEKPLEFAVDNLYHYTLGDLGDWLPASSTERSMRLFPLTVDHVDEDIPNSDAAQKFVDRMIGQKLVADADYGVTKYGAILYQLARKFFLGSPAAPVLTELIKVGNDVPGWRTGRMLAHGALDGVQLEFPHTYLGGMPYVCTGAAASLDPCATGRPTWPIWVPDAFPTSGTASSLTTTSPPRSNRAALIYLGWAAHMIQDAAMPHHAANWTGVEHENQDNFGDLSVYYNHTNFLGLGAYWMDNYMATALDDLLGPEGAPKSAQQICSTLNIVDSQLTPNVLNWRAAQPLFLDNAREAYRLRSQAATAADAREYIKHAILGTIKLLLCAPPGSGYYAHAFDSGDSRSFTGTGDWAQGSYKAECGEGDRMVGVSATSIGMRPDLRGHSALCVKNDSNNYSRPIGVQARSLLGPDDRADFTTGDWDVGFHKAECGRDQVVTGIAATPDNRMSHVLCSPMLADSSSSSCQALVFSSWWDERLDVASGDWAIGYSKNECRPNQVLKGVSATGTGELHAILCCDVAPIRRTAPADCGVLTPGEGLRTGEGIFSCDGRFRLDLQTDGNLVLRQATSGGNSVVLWQTGVAAPSGSTLVMQADGNLVLYDPAAQALWHTSTWSNQGSSFRIQNDGNLVIYDPDARAIWSSNTCCR
jgi:hypothetical protein